MIKILPLLLSFIMFFSACSVQTADVSPQSLEVDNNNSESEVKSTNDPMIQLGNLYSTDGTYIYYDTKKMEGADVDTIEVLGANHARDENFDYFNQFRDNTKRTLTMDKSKWITSTDEFYGFSIQHPPELWLMKHPLGYFSRIVNYDKDDPRYKSAPKDYITIAITTFDFRSKISRYFPSKPSIEEFKEVWQEVGNIEEFKNPKQDNDITFAHYPTAEMAQGVVIYSISPDLENYLTFSMRKIYFQNNREFVREIISTFSRTE